MVRVRSAVTGLESIESSKTGEWWPLGMVAWYFAVHLLLCLKFWMNVTSVLCTKKQADYIDLVILLKSYQSHQCRKTGGMLEPILAVSYRIVSATVVSADITCITAGSSTVDGIALHTMIKGRSSDPSHACRARTHTCVLFYGPWYGRELEGREAEGDRNLIPASPWHKDRQYWSQPPSRHTPPPAGSDNNSQLSITLTFLPINQS